MAANVKDIRSVSEVRPIQLNKIPADIKSYNAALSAVSEAQGEAGSLIKKLEKDRGYNRAAFKLACSLSKKTVQKRQDFLMTLDAIREKLGWDNEQADALDKDGKVVALADHRNGDDEDEEDEAPAAPAEASDGEERVLQS